MLCIGDVHGKYRQYREIIRGRSESIQVGDMGVGFFSVNRGPKPLRNPPHYAMVPDHRFIRGNHDNPDVCKKNSQWIPDGTVLNDVMFVGGGLSIDREFRHEGYDWWADEELSINELNSLVDKFRSVKPRVMITHDCPEQIAVEMQRLSGWEKLRPEWASRTRQAFDGMWSAHPPELWIFGHWHKSFDATAGGTRFVCLEELESKDFDFEIN